MGFLLIVVACALLAILACYVDELLDIALPPVEPK